MKVKRILAIAAAALTVVSMVGCAKDNSTETTNTSAAESKQTEIQSQAEEINYPTSNIEIIVPYAAGGATDLIARAFEQVLPKYLPGSTNVAVVNVAGGGTVTGMTSLYQSEADGYTIGCIAGAPLSITPHMGNTEYTHDSFCSIAQVTSIPQVFAVAADSEWNTIQDVIAYVKDNPGAFSYGIGGATNVPNLAFSVLLMEENLEMQCITYNGNAEVLTAFLGGHINAYTGAASDIKSYVEAGQAKILLNMGTITDDYYSDAPTMESLGYDSLGDAYVGFIAPPETPAEIIEILEKAFAEAVKDVELLKNFTSIGVSTAYKNAEEFQTLITDYYIQYGEVMKYLGQIN